jgi:biotin carboxyl carrier protein
MKQNSKFGIISTLLFIIIVMNYGCENKKDAAENKAEVKAVVTIVNPVEQNLTEYIKLNGVTFFQKKDNIRSTNTGYIISLKLKQGDRITTGEPFCSIGTKEQIALKNISDSSLFKFQKPLSVIANASGVITAINSLQGDYVSEGDVLAAVCEPSSLVVQVNVPYEYNQYVNAGKICEIILPDGRIIRSTITGAMPTVDASSQAQSFFIRLPNESLPENLNVTIRIAYKQKNNVLCISSGAIQTDEMQKEFWLMKAVDDSLALKIPIKIGLQNDSITEIISDKIAVTDKIILQGAYGLVDSSLITIDK